MKTDILIASHPHTDFDALASMVGIFKLYPDAHLFLSGSTPSYIRKFVNLYLSNYPWVKPLKNNYSILIIVDTIRLEYMLPFLKKGGLIKIYDHHFDNKKYLSLEKKYSDYNFEFNITKTGANITFIWEYIKKFNLKYSKIELTLFYLGLMEDTGHFTYTDITWRDAETLRDFLKLGTNIKIAYEFLNNPLSKEQKILLEKILKYKKQINIKGLNILICHLKIDKYIENVDIIIKKIREQENSDAIFVILNIKNKKTYIIARSNLDNINVGKILENFNGGGHKNAASAITKENNIIEKLIKLLEKWVIPLKTAKDIMSYPVKTIFPDTKIHDAHKIILRYGFKGLPVINKKDKKLIGIITNSDMSKAIIHNLSHSPVKAYMTIEVINASLNTSIMELKRIITKHKISCIPIVDTNMHILGIITLSDLIPELYNKDSHIFYKSNIIKRNLNDALEILPKRLQYILIKIGKFADEYKVKVYLVGGIVRDIILKRENTDIDLTVCGDAIEFAERIHKLFKKSKLHVFSKFKTATLKIQDFIIDLASSRVEFYENIADLPVVELSNLKKDLYRRDFTINAMAISINFKTYGQLIDYYGGFEDLKNKKIRILHKLSFIEDPTRILRCVKFMGRFNFSLEGNTLKMFKNALYEKALTMVSKERITKELIYILSEENFKDILKIMIKWKILPQIFKGFQRFDTVLKKYDFIYKIIFSNPYILKKITKKEINIIILLSCLTQKQRIEFLNIYLISNNIKTLIETKNKSYTNAKKRLSKQKQISKSEIYNTLKIIPISLILLWLLDTQNKKFKNRLILYITKLINHKNIVTGKDLLKIGLQPSPLIGKILIEINNAYLDGHIIYKKEALELAERLYNKWIHIKRKK